MNDFALSHLVLILRNFRHDVDEMRGDAKEMKTEMDIDG